MEETLRVRKVPKSAMQHVRQYTGLRGFAELGPDGSPLAYWIELSNSASLAAPSAPTRKRSPGYTMSPSALLTSTKKKMDYQHHSIVYRVGEAVREITREGAVPRKDILTTGSELTGHTPSQVSTAISQLVKEGYVREV